MENRRQVQKPPAWGPYSKKYMGLSHIPGRSSVRGARFDCVVFPTVASSGVPAPNVTVPSHYHPWECAPDLSYFSYRYDLEAEFYADVSFSQVEKDCYLIRTEFVNQSSLSQNCVLNYFMAMEYPFPEEVSVRLPEHSVLVDATCYDEYTYASPRPWDKLNPDAAKKGVFQDPAFTGGQGLGDRASLFGSHAGVRSFRPFGAQEGDCVRYTLRIEQPFQQAVLHLRVRRPLLAKEDGHSCFEASGLFSGDLKLPAGAEPQVVSFPVGALEAGDHTLTLRAKGGAGVELDCLVLSEEGEAPVFERRAFERKPAVTCAGRPVELDQYPPYGRACPVQPVAGETLLYRYEDVKEPYGLIPYSHTLRLRNLPSGSLEDALITRLSNGDRTYDDLCAPFTFSFSRKRSDPGFYHNLVASAIFVHPGESMTEYALLFTGEEIPSGMTPAECEQAYKAARAKAARLSYSPAGKPFELSGSILEATLMTNAVYPILIHGEPVVHFTPGKRWDSLYTWDSGFTGLGMLEASPALAEYVLDSYLAHTDNPDYAYVQHGSPVPVVLFLYYELFCRSDGAEKERLRSYYPRAKRMYDFLAGAADGSTTSPYRSGLTHTFDYFYNSSGMDDYPAQVLTHRLGIERRVAPALCASMLIRSARMLGALAGYYGISEDVESYGQDIARLSDALQRFAWDEESGYYGYTLHDEKGDPCGILRTESGENANKGLDGAYPLMAGICTPKQRERLLGHLKNKQELWSAVGISAVDQSSGYYEENGYWNGNVWFAHQWFYFKTLLDLGEADFAFEVADTALQAWKREVDHSHYTFEFLNIATGRGGWFHHFAGLSTPILLWGAAYYKPGRVTCGFDMLVERQEFSQDKRSCLLRLRRVGGQTASTVVAVLSPEADGRTARCAGESLPLRMRMPGVAEITLPAGFTEGEIEIG
ncbi:MAG: hypothetical protein HFG26_10520 [Provencibacterium sp.]|jgi:hypothetical protein|nr:hypothetical protein [Provencibacterium sp.]